MLYLMLKTEHFLIRSRHRAKMSVLITSIQAGTGGPKKKGLQTRPERHRSIFIANNTMCLYRIPTKILLK